MKLSYLSLHLKTVLCDGSSKNSGAHTVECFRLQVFKENLFANQNGIETSGSSSGSSSTDESTTDQAGREMMSSELKKCVERECNQNRETAIELVKRAASESEDEDGGGLMNIWDIFSPERDATGKVTGMRKSESAERMYWMFVDTCVFNTIPRKDWKKEHVNKNLSDFVHPTNEAFAMLVLENIAPDFINKDTGELKSREEMKQKSSSSRYTKGSFEKQSGRKKGWRASGIERYNKLVKNVYTRRKITKMRDSMDSALRKRYVNEIEEAVNAECELNKNETRFKCVVGLDLSAGDEELKNAVEIPDEYKNINCEFV